MVATTSAAVCRFTRWYFAEFDGWFAGVESWLELAKGGVAARGIAEFVRGTHCGFVGCGRRYVLDLRCDDDGR
jgi:hypothetical protein